MFLFMKKLFIIILLLSAYLLSTVNAMAGETGHYVCGVEGIKLGTVARRDFIIRSIMFLQYPCDQRQPRRPGPSTSGYSGLHHGAPAHLGNKEKDFNAMTCKLRFEYTCIQSYRQ